jgi:predicted ATP-grasp superfamily ATP-dependent carboligase
VIEVEGVPPLNNAVMVAAFEGWNDAADAASGVITHLIDTFDARPIAEFDPEDYYDFQVNRPTVSVGDRGIRSIAWPTTRIYLAGTPDGQDLVLVRGIEPSMRWRAFVSELIGLAFELDVETVVTLGALLADTPHTRPVPITGSTSAPGLAQTLSLEPSRYEGPSGIVGVLTDATTRAGLETVSFWAAVPHYVAHPPCPKATLALLRELEDVLDTSIPHGDLEEESLAWQRGVDELAEDDDEVAEYVRTLEAARDTAALPEASGDAIAREFERYLRRRGDGPGLHG